MNQTSKLLAFTRLLQGLKNLERFKGQYYWKEYPQPERYESVADHSWRMAMMLVVIESSLSQPIDFKKAMTMALIHDLPEIIAGDPSPLGSDGTGKDSHAYNAELKAKKYEKEKQAAQEIFGALPEDEKKNLYSLWLEYEGQQSFEGRLVKALDRIEAKLQVLEYTKKDGMYKSHLDFTIAYGSETLDVDASVKAFGSAVVEELQKNYKEFIPPKQA